MSEFELPLSLRDRSWIDLRERLARTAREIHFAAVASDAVNGPVLLTVAENLADLALSIPMPPCASMPGTLVKFSTLRAAQDQAASRTPNDVRDRD